MTEFRCCAVVPTYDNPETIRSVVERIRLHLPDVIVVDDGSEEAGRAACAALARDGLARVVHLDRNQGKGAATRRAFAEADAAGFSHAFQIDADGQHDLDAIPEFLAALEVVEGDASACAVFGAPVYDESAPTIRRVGREITRFWVDLETGRGVIQDAMIGFRIYPVSKVCQLPAKTNRMSFDVEIAVLLVWAGVKIVNLPVRVRYLTAEEGGLSHFSPVLDNLRLSWLHCRLCTTGAIRWCLSWIPLPGILKSS